MVSVADVALNRLLKDSSMLCHCACPDAVAGRSVSDVAISNLLIARIRGLLRFARNDAKNSFSTAC